MPSKVFKSIILNIILPLFISSIRKWDNKPFGINTMEAEVMDPQQRLALETSYRALEDGGFTLDDISGTNTAVYMGRCLKVISYKSD